MIIILGEKNTAEYRAAKIIEQKLLEIWPDIADTPIEKDHIIIRAGACLSGYKRSEIDIVLIAQFAEGRSFRPRRAIRDTEGRIVRDRPISIRRLLAVGEVKDHTGDRVRAIGENIDVLYKGQAWKSATNQNIEQTHSLRNYLFDRSLSAYVCRFVYLSNITERLGESINPSMSAAEFISRIIETGRVNLSSGKTVFSGFRAQDYSKLFSLAFFKKHTPSNLDRKRMEQIAQKSSMASEIIADTNSRLTQIVGPGGTGKTITMLQIAKEAFRTYGERSLFLTYNVALASDIQRLLNLSGLTGGDEGEVRIQTVMSFLYGLFFSANLISEDEFQQTSFSDYEDFLHELLDLFREDPQGIGELVGNHQNDLSFDRVFIDEAQDWSQAEVEVILSIFPDSQIIVANSGQQMIRNQKSPNWFKGVSRSERKIRNLNLCLRQKSAISAFICNFSTLWRVEWDLEVNSNAAGGRIIFSDNAYSELNVHDDLLKKSQEAGVVNFDWLYLRMGRHAQELDKKMERLFVAEDSYILDLSDPILRREPFVDKKAFRFLEYESCRGLEGWVVILEKFDTFLNEKLAAAFDRDVNEHFEISSLSLEEKNFMWNWISMVMARAMDTLVININDRHHGSGRLLWDFAKAQDDLVEFL